MTRISQANLNLACCQEILSFCKQQRTNHTQFLCNSCWSHRQALYKLTRASFLGSSSNSALSLRGRTSVKSLIRKVDLYLALLQPLGYLEYSLLCVNICYIELSVHTYLEEYNYNKILIVHLGVLYLQQGECPSRGKWEARELEKYFLSKCILQYNSQDRKG